MEKVFDLLYKHNVTPNGWLVLTWVRDRIQRLEYINDQTERYRLEKTGHLIADNTGSFPVFKLTKKGEGLLQAVDKKLLHHYAGKSTDKPDDQRKEEWKPFIQQFNQLWPAGKRTNSSGYYRCNENELFERFLWFFDEYPEYSWEEILEAAKRYVSPFHTSMDFTYLQSAKYFIKKEDKNKTVTSNLADNLYNIRSGNDQLVNDGTFYFGP